MCGAVSANHQTCLPCLMNVAVIKGSQTNGDCRTIARAMYPTIMGPDSLSYHLARTKPAIGMAAAISVAMGSKGQRLEVWATLKSAPPAVQN